MSFSAESPPAGWYPDPAGSGGQRYWDGGSWSQVTRPGNTRPGDYVPDQAQAPANSPYGQTQTSYDTAPGQAPWGQGMARQPVLAGFWWRVLASILDSLILALPMGLLTFLILPGPVDDLMQYFNDSFNAGLTDGILPEEPTAALTAITLLTAVIMFVYQTAMVALKGATLGKLILGMRVLKVDAPVGTNPSWAVAALRAAGAGLLGRIPIVNFIDPLVMLFTARKQTIHDLLARTIVYKK